MPTIMDAHGCEKKVTSLGQGNFNSVGAGAGIAALLGQMNGGCGGCNNGGLLGGLFGGNRNCDCYVNKTELALSQQVAALQAEKYADMIAREEAALIFNESRRQDDKIAGVIKETTDGLIKVGTAVAEQSKEIACLKVEVARNREDAKNYTDQRVDMEAELRKAADQNVLAYTNAELAKKISGTLVLPESEINFGGCKPVLCNTRCLGTEGNPINVDIVELANQVARQIKSAK